MTATFSDGIVSLPTFYLGLSRFHLEIKTAQWGDVTPGYSKSREKCVLAWAWNLSPLPGNPARWTLLLDLLFQPFPPTNILCIPCALNLQGLNVHQHGNLWSEKAYATVLIPSCISSPYFKHLLLSWAPTLHLWVVFSKSGECLEVISMVKILTEKQLTMEFNTSKKYLCSLTFICIVIMTF